MSTADILAANENVVDRRERLLDALADSGLSAPELVRRIDPRALAYIEAVVEARLTEQANHKLAKREQMGP